MKFVRTGTIIFPLIVLVLVISLSAFYLVKSDKLFKASTVEATLNGNKLQVNFDLTEKDLKEAENLSRDLGVTSDWTKGISIDLENADISAFFPIKAKIAFEGDRVMLRSKDTLIKPVLREGYSLSTGSAKFDFKTDGKGFNLEAQEIATQVRQATISGQLKISKRLEALFPLLERVGRIELRVNSNTAKGEIRFK